MDYLGPFFVIKESSKEKVKVWILCFTCMWSRAVNLKICDDLSVQECLRAFQLHCFDYGLPNYCVSDMGSQLTAAANKITDFLSNPQTFLEQVPWLISLGPMMD